MESKSIAKRDPAGLIEAVEKKFQEAEKLGHLLTPITKLDYLPPMHTISIRFVKVADTETYHDTDFKENERALTKEALMKISGAAGVDWIDSRRLDDCRDPHYCNIQVAGVMRDFDGQQRMIRGSKEVDFRDGSPQTKGWSDKRIARARQHIQQLAETKAMERAIRAALSIRQKYTVEELKKPFIVPKLVFVPDDSDPEIRRALILSALDGKRNIYGPNGGSPLSAGAIDIQKVEDGDAPPPTKKETEAPAAVEETKPEPESETNSEETICSCDCGCKNKLSDKVIAFSMNEYGQALCYACQPKSKFYNKEKHGEKDSGQSDIPF